MNLKNYEVVIFDGLRKDVNIWKSHAQFIASRIGLNKDDFLLFKLRLYNSKDVGGINFKQEDAFNCGPMTCMVLWYLFCPNEAKINQPVMTFRKTVITKLKEMFQSVIDCNDLLCSVRDNKNALQISSDKKRKLSQEKQASKMKRLYGKSIVVNIGDTVKIYVEKKLKTSHHNLNPVGIVVDVNKRTKTILVLTRHGLIGKNYFGKMREFYLDPKSYEVIHNDGFPSKELVETKKVLKASKSFDRRGLNLI